MEQFIHEQMFFVLNMGIRYQKIFSLIGKLMLEKTIKQPISRIIEALGWNWDELINSNKTVTKQGTLFDNF